MCTHVKMEVVKMKILKKQRILGVYSRAFFELCDLSTIYIKLYLMKTTINVIMECARSRADLLARDNKHARAGSLPLMKSRFRRIPSRNISFADGNTAVLLLLLLLLYPELATRVDTRTGLP